MRTKKKVVIDISANGYGHLAQISPILHGMKSRFNVDIVIRSEISKPICAEFLKFEFEHQRLLIDPNLKMLSPIEADVDGLYNDYRSLFLDNHSLIRDDAEKLRKLEADLLISNISAASLIAAEKANLPSICISSLNWADIFEHYCIQLNGAPTILNKLREAYNLAKCFIQLRPNLDSDWISSRYSIPAIAAHGINKKASLVKEVKAQRLILVTLGGIPGGSDKIRIPKVPNTQWLVNATVKSHHSYDRQDIINYELLDESFINLVASADAVISKCGYGIVTECARNNVKLMYVHRENWPENEGLEAWASKHIEMRSITREELGSGNYGEMIIELLDKNNHGLKRFSDDSGVNLVLDILASYLNEPSSN